MKSIRFRASLIAFWLNKSEVDFDSNSVKIKRPNLLFGFLPMGEVNEMVPVSQIASVSSGFSLMMGPIVGGLLLAVLPFLWLFISLVVPHMGIAGTMQSEVPLLQALGCFVVLIPFAAVGVLLILNSLRISVRITTTAGMSKWLSMPMLEKQKAVQIEKIVNALISTRMDDTNTRMQNETLMADNARNTDRIISGIASAINARATNR